MTTIARIEISHHRLPLDPPFPASWDPQPRAAFPATIVRVVTADGHVGIGSGDSMYGFADHEGLFIGEDPLDLDRHGAALANIDFHAGRPWPLDVALWDLAGQLLDRPVWDLLRERSESPSDRTSQRGRGRAVRAYASSAVHRPVAEMVEVARRAMALGFPALKVRFGRPGPTGIDDDLAVIRAIRDAIGTDLELMVDCNQGWRMPWDVRQPWDVEQATPVAAALAAERVCWIEEPLHRGDVAGLAELRRRVDLPVAGGEMTREPYEFATLLAADALDVYQPDCVCTQGITGLRRLAAHVVAAGKVFTPHTWGNGIGLLANAHLTAGTVGAPFLEFPFDPPEWTTARRDFPLAGTVEVDGDGWLHLGDRPGLGLSLDEETLRRTATSAATFS